MEARAEGSAAGDPARGGVPPWSEPPESESLVIAGRWRSSPLIAARSAEQAAERARSDDQARSVEQVSSIEQVRTTDSPSTQPRLDAPVPPSTSTTRTVPAPPVVPRVRRGRASALTAALTVLAVGWAGAVVSGTVADPAAALWPTNSNGARLAFAGPNPSGATGPASATSPIAASPATAAAPSSEPAASEVSPSSEPDPTAPTDVVVAEVADPGFAPDESLDVASRPLGDLRVSVQQTAQWIGNVHVPANGGLRISSRTLVSLSSRSVRRGGTVTVQVQSQIHYPTVNYLPRGKGRCVGGLEHPAWQYGFGFRLGQVAAQPDKAQLMGIYPVAGAGLPTGKPVAKVWLPAPKPSASTVYSADHCFQLTTVDETFRLKVPASLTPGVYQVSAFTPVAVTAVFSLVNGRSVSRPIDSVRPILTGTLPILTVTA